MSNKSNIHDFKEADSRAYLNLVNFFKDAMEGKHHTTGTKVPPSMCEWIKAYHSPERFPKRWPYDTLSVIPSENPSDVDKWLADMDIMVKAFLYQSITFIEAERNVHKYNNEVTVLELELSEMSHWTKANLLSSDAPANREALLEKLGHKRALTSRSREISLALGSSLTYMLKA